MLAAVDLTLLMTLVLCSTRLFAPVAMGFARCKAACKVGRSSRSKSDA
jgi:hypothetical protein